jgi:hypothetical protein
MTKEEYPIAQVAVPKTLGEHPFSAEIEKEWSNMKGIKLPQKLKKIGKNLTRTQENGL